MLCCVDNDAYNGSYTKKPFHAKHNDINFIAVYVDCQQVPAEPLPPNFVEGRYVRSYVILFALTKKVTQDEGNGLTRADFSNGFTFFGFDLTPGACDGWCFHMAQKGNLHIGIHFATAVDVVAYGEFEAVLEIDKSRNVIYDY